MSIGPDATESPPAFASETPATIPPTPSEPPSSPSPSAARLPVGQRCTNEVLGYAVSYPADWYANAEIEQEFGDPIPACTYFSSQPMDIAPNAGLPPMVAISFERWTEAPPAGEGWEVVSREETSVAELPAVVTELEQISDAGAPFSAAGDRTYGYEVELPDGTVLTASTGTTADGDYAEHKEVLDQMMATVEVTGDANNRSEDGDMPHPLIDQLGFTRSEFIRGIRGVTDDDARRRIGPMNSISWNEGHLAWQEQQYFVTWPSGERPFPEIDREFASGGPASTPPLQRVLDAWRAITAAADPWLDTLTSDDLERHVVSGGTELKRR